MYRDNQTILNTAGIKQTGATVVIGDPHPAFAAALAGIYTSAYPGVKVLTTTCFDELQRHAMAHPGSTLLVNPKMDKAPGLSTATILQETTEMVRLVIITDHEDEGLSGYFIARGAQTTISKSAEFSQLQDTLLRGIRHDPSENRTNDNHVAFSQDFYEGLANLTRRQATILNYLKQGKLNKQIAHDLGISEATVKHHVSALLSALGFYSRSQLVAMINELGINVDYRPRSRARSNLRRLQDYRSPGSMVSPTASAPEKHLAAAHA